MKNKNLSAVLSFLFPGLGHLYIGKYLDAVVFIAGTGILWYVFLLRGNFLRSIGNPRYYLILSALIFVYLYSIVDAYQKTK